MSTQLWPGRNWLVHQGGQWTSKGASSVLRAAPHHWCYQLSSTSVLVSCGLRFSQEQESYYEWCKLSQLHIPDENLVPGDRRWNQGRDVSTKQHNHYVLKIWKYFFYKTNPLCQKKMGW